MKPSTLVKNIKKWTFEADLRQLREDAETTILNDPSWLCDCIDRKIDDLSELWSIVENMFQGEDGKEWREDYGIDLNDAPEVNISKYLREDPSHGEFLGQVLAAMGNFSEEDRKKILPALTEACRYTADHGVDH